MTGRILRLCGLWDGKLDNALCLRSSFALALGYSEENNGSSLKIATYMYLIVDLRVVLWLFS